MGCVVRGEEGNLEERSAQWAGGGVRGVEPLICQKTRGGGCISEEMGGNKCKRETGLTL